MFEKDIEKIDNDIVKKWIAAIFKICESDTDIQFIIVLRLIRNHKYNFMRASIFFFVREKSPSEKKSLEVLAMAKTSSEVLDFGARQNLKNQNLF